MCIYCCSVSLLATTIKKNEHNLMQWIGLLNASCCWYLLLLLQKWPQTTLAVYDEKKLGYDLFKNLSLQNGM